MEIAAEAALPRSGDGRRASHPRRDNYFKFSEKLRDVFCDGTPYDIVINKIIGMNKFIPHAYKFWPRDLRILCL